MKALILAITILSITGSIGHAQEPVAMPQRRFAIRCNTLAILNLSGVFELEYSVSQRVGLFVGGGMGVQDVYPTSLQVFFKREWQFCEIPGKGVYTGFRVGIPIWKLVGLSVKGIVQYTYYKAAGFGCTPTMDGTPLPDPFVVNTANSFVGLAYAQTFAKRYFVEPMVGFGPYWTSTLSRRGIKPDDWRSAMQLNLGVKF